LVSPSRHGSSLAIGIGGITIRLHTPNSAFLHMLAERYAGFPGIEGPSDYEFEVDLTPPPALASDEDVRVWWAEGRWNLTRGDFRAVWDPVTRRGRIRQSPNPWSVDTVIRIVHTLVLARQGGFLVHASSAIRNGRAFLFAGVSGAGKTTISRLAPADATLLTDEMSYVRLETGQYFAYGTPFAGELAKPGENVRAPLGGLFLLSQGPENRIEEIPSAQAAAALLACVLFFAEDPQLVSAVFRSVCDFVEHVPVRRLTFLPDQRVWELIR
jgi:hypothetical protein